MSKTHFKASYSKGKYKINIGLSLYSWKDDDIYYIYSPALDITGYGKTVEEANKSFKITLDEFVTYTYNKNTIFDVLEQLGWTVNRKKKRVHAPDFEELIEDNQLFKDIITKTNWVREKQNIELILD